MTNKINNLYEQCLGEKRYEEKWGLWVGELDYEKFANLILQECIDAVKYTDTTHGYTTYDVGLIKATIAKSIESIENKFK